METHPNNTSNGVALQSDAVFEQIKERVGADEAKAKSINAVFAYKITKNGQVAKEWSKYLLNVDNKTNLCPNIDFCFVSSIGPEKRTSV